MAVNEIQCGDSRNLLTNVESASVRLIHTSPPYNIDRSYNAYSDSRPRREYLAFIQQIVSECFRVLMPGGSLFWQTGYTSESDSVEYIYPLDHLTFDLFLQSGFRLRDRIIWRYFGGTAFKRKFTNKHETILWWTKPGGDAVFDVFPVRERSKEYDSRNNLFGRNPGNVWEVDRVAFGSSEQTSHVAVFPEEISERIVLSASREGELCLDPFSGSGTLCKVARSRGRNYLGFELDRHYYEESRIRLGYCQHGEFENVLSQAMKDHVFSGSSATMDIVAVADRLQDLLIRGRDARLDELLTGSELTAIAGFQEGAVPKTRKAEIWRGLDSYLAGANGHSPLRLIDESFLCAFRLNRSYNAVMRLALAVRWLEKFRSMSPDHLPGLIKAIGQNEPSSYQLSRGKLTLKNYVRDIRAAKGESTSAERTVAQESLELTHDT